MFWRKFWAFQMYWFTLCQVIKFQKTNVTKKTKQNNWTMCVIWHSWQTWLITSEGFPTGSVLGGSAITKDILNFRQDSVSAHLTEHLLQDHYFTEDFSNPYTHSYCQSSPGLAACANFRVPPFWMYTTYCMSDASHFKITTIKIYELFIAILKQKKTPSFCHSEVEIKLKKNTKQNQYYSRKTWYAALFLTPLLLQLPCDERDVPTL